MMYLRLETMSTITEPDGVSGSSDTDETRPSSSYTVVSSLRFIAFWGAVVLPFLYVPLLISGLDTLGQLQTFVLLMALNAVALVFGHRYRART